MQSLPCFEIPAADILKGGRRVKDADNFLPKLSFVTTCSEYVMRKDVILKKGGGGGEEGG